MFRVGAIFFTVAIIIGAFGAHALKGFGISHEMLGAFETGVKYQFYMALFMMLIGLGEKRLKEKHLNFFSYFSLLGIMGFSGSLYLYVLSSQKFFAMITPVGGIFMILSGLTIASGIKES